MSDGFVKSPTSVLRFIPFSLRRTLSTPRDTKFARLEFGAFFFAIYRGSQKVRVNHILRLFSGFPPSREWRLGISVCHSSEGGNDDWV